jgi:hypothetical protein
LQPFHGIFTLRAISSARTQGASLEPKEHHLKLIGCLLLLSGWIIVLSALVMLPGFAQRAAFIAAGMAVEALGLVLLTRGYTLDQRRAK